MKKGFEICRNEKKVSKKKEKAKCNKFNNTKFFSNFSRQEEPRRLEIGSIGYSYNIIINIYRYSRECYVCTHRKNFGNYNLDCVVLTRQNVDNIDSL